MANDVIISMHKDGKRVIFKRTQTANIHPITGYISKYSITINDDNATFPTITLNDITETEFLEKIKECFGKGYVSAPYGGK